MRRNSKLLIFNFALLAINSAVLGYVLNTGGTYYTAYMWGRVLDQRLEQCKVGVAKCRKSVEAISKVYKKSQDTLNLLVKNSKKRSKKKNPKKGSRKKGKRKSK